MNLWMEALIKVTCGLLLVGALIFLPAGTIAYTYGWLLMGLLFIPMLIAGFVMLRKSPAFLKKTVGCQGKANYSERRYCLFRADVCCGICVGRFGLPLWLV